VCVSFVLCSLASDYGLVIAPTLDMKFAKYQANNLVPEWRTKYLDVYISQLMSNSAVQGRQENLEGGSEKQGPSDHSSLP
jgi:hypothetical protein